jgi:hypothetical protein
VLSPLTARELENFTLRMEPQLPFGALIALKALLSGHSAHLKQNETSVGNRT